MEFSKCSSAAWIRLGLMVVMILVALRWCFLRSHRGGVVVSVYVGESALCNMRYTLRARLRD